MADLDIDETDAATCEFISLYDGIKGYIYDMKHESKIQKQPKVTKKEVPGEGFLEQQAPIIAGGPHWSMAAGAIASHVAFWMVVHGLTKK